MYRSRVTFPISSLNSFKEQLLTWAYKNYEQVCWLDSNESKNQSVESVLAVGNISKLTTNYKNAFHQLKKYYNNTNDYIFGYLSYDLKNDVEKLDSNNYDLVDFADIHFFQPQKIIRIENKQLVFEYPESLSNEIEADLNTIKNTNSDNTLNSKTVIKSRITESEYITTANTLLQEIQRGNIYEVNFCQEFYAENTSINPVKTYTDLNNISTPPFACFLKNKEQHLLCASPERFLKKEGNYIQSEPIKGTAKRYTDPKRDNQSKLGLKTNIKEIAENVMIVDLVRNDLSHIAKKGTVNVKELCEIYTYQQVHQMISKIGCEVKDNTHPIDILKHCFPMGSMTGAPKISAMKLIEKHESSKRGLYSGAVGYITPNGDFDFNVVIRSILYNQEKKALSFSVGSAITAKANPHQEYLECLLKAKAMREVLEK